MSLREETTLALGNSTSQGSGASTAADGDSADDEDDASTHAESSSNSGGFLQTIATLFGGTANAVSSSASASASAADTSSEVPTSIVATAAGSYNGRRIGASLPISCPRHRGVKCKHVTHTKDFPDHATWHDFCKEACTFQIPQCGHLCAKLCHSPVLDAHTRQEHCKVALPRPCDLHADVPLYCGKLTILPHQSLQTALSVYKCQVMTLSTLH